MNVCVCVCVVIAHACTSVCVCVCVCVSVYVCVWGGGRVCSSEVCFNYVWFFAFVMGYVLQFGKKYHIKECTIIIIDMPIGV